MSVQRLEAVPTVPVPRAVDRVGVYAPGSPSGGPALDAPAIRPSAGSSDLAGAVRTLNALESTRRTNLNFSIDKDSGKTVVKVIDQTDGTVLRQMPSEEALRIARTLSGSRGALIEGEA